MPDKLFTVHSMTVEDENGVVATLDLDNATITPDNLDPGIAANLWFRLGLLLGGGISALNKSFEEK